MTKSDIIHAIISSRNDDEEVPPSSPPGKSEGGYSTDDGHDGGGEETDANLGSLKNALRRRGTVQDMGRPIIKNTIARSISLGTGDDFASKQPSKKTARIAKDVKSPHHDETTGSRYVASYRYPYLSKHTILKKTTWRFGSNLTCSIFDFIYFAITSRHSPAFSNDLQ